MEYKFNMFLEFFFFKIFNFFFFFDFLNFVLIFSIVKYFIFNIIFELIWPTHFFNFKGFLIFSNKNNKFFEIFFLNFFFNSKISNLKMRIFLKYW